VEEALDLGKNVILDIEVQGAGLVKQKMPEAVTIFLIPGSFSELEKRIRGRGEESDETIKKRLETAKREYAVGAEYDYIIINDDPAVAAGELLSVIAAEKCRADRRLGYLTF